MTNEDLRFFENLFGGTGSLDKGFGYKYNEFACSEAIKIANSLKNKDSIIEYNKNSDDEKFRYVDISDSHSGNTFQMACALAISYLPMIRDQKISKIIEDEKNKNNI